MDDEYLNLEMEDDNGNKVNINVLAKFDDGKNEYVIGQDANDSIKHYIFELIETKDGEMLVSINDEKELNRLTLIANKIVLEEIK